MVAGNRLYYGGFQPGYESAETKKINRPWVIAPLALTQAYLYVMTCTKNKGASGGGTKKVLQTLLILVPTSPVF